jgi:hypothetical protein
VKRGPWSPEEDATLKSYLETHRGTGGNWIALPQKAGTLPIPHSDLPFSQTNIRANV